MIVETLVLESKATDYAGFDWRCVSCNKLLGKFVLVSGRIMCSRCGQLNQVQIVDIATGLTNMI